MIDTKAGAAGAVGAQVAANAKPDGYTLLLHIVSISGFSEVDKLFGWQPKFSRADFIPIARFIADPCVLIVNDKTPYKTLEEFTEDARKRPNDIEFYLWVGLFAPKGTPEPIVTKIRDFTREAAMTPKFKELMANIGQEVDYLDQAEFKAFWDADAKRVEDAVRSIGRVEG